MSRVTRRLVVDLRSDTVTQPPAAMRRAIARAAVGDDGYREDPTANALEALAARTLGKEDALLVSSGTMANLVAIGAHAGGARSVVVGDRSDIWQWEAASVSLLNGVGLHTVPTEDDGRLRIDALDEAIDACQRRLSAPAALICLENTHALSGGSVLDLDYLAAVRRWADARGLFVHVDGARLFNAAVALRTDVHRLCADADSISFCLSKGLAAPIGSVLAGRREFVARARRLRRLLGGAMRQVGLIAAAGIYALRHMVDRLADDHRHAQLLARELDGLAGIALLTPSPQTNIVLWRLQPDAEPAPFVDALARRGIGVLDLGDGIIRAVTHVGVSAADVHRAADTVHAVLRRSAVGPSVRAVEVA